MPPRVRLLSLAAAFAPATTAAALQFTAEGFVQLTPGPGAPVYELMPVDVDGDGDLDVVARISIEARIVWIESLGGGTFGAVRDVMLNVPQAFSVDVEDLDGDGDPDVVVSVFATDEVFWTENLDGLGSYGPPRLITDAADGVYSVYASDLDGDGDRDVAVVSSTDTEVTWHENLDGAGSFGPELVVDQGTPFLFDIVTEDIDGDGDADLCAGSFTDGARWYANDGAGAFSAATLITAGPGAIHLSTPDLDGDGAPDVLYGKDGVGGDNAVSWQRNVDGAGAFGPAVDIVQFQLSPGYVLASDLDLDGDLDVLHTATFTGVPTDWFRNAGAGTFEPPQVVEPLGGLELNAADLSGDGQPNVLVARFNGFDWYSGDLCDVKVAASETSRVGTPPNVEALLPGASGGPQIGETWDPSIDSSLLPAGGYLLHYLGISPVGTNLSTGLGTVLIDLGRTDFHVVPAGQAFAIEFPNDCALAGLQLSAQGAARRPGSFVLTNALDVVVGNP